MKTWAASIGRYLKERYILGILAAWLVFLMEFLSRSSARDAMSWTYRHIPEFLFNTLLVAGLLLLFTAVTGRTRWAYWIVFLLSFALSLVSGIKLKMLGVPLLPWDFVLAGETKDMTGYLRNIMNTSTIIGLVIYIGASIGLLYMVPNIVTKVRWKERGFMVLTAFLFVSLVYFQTPAFMKKAFGVEVKPWNQSENVLDNGLLLTTVKNLDQMSVGKMKGYNEDAIAAIVEKAQEQEAAGETIKPNIIVVLSESFWDPTIIPGLKFSRDPIPNFHALSKKYPSGWLLSPQYGGGTANVEFEVLTGNTLRFLPQGSIAYNQFITHEVDSLASIAARQGYTSTAISPFHNWYFNARKVYEYFGFQKYIPIEFFKPNYSGPYIADDEVAHHIITETSKSSGSDFVFANTMENHFHYYPGKFEANTIKVEGVTGESKGMFETLAQGLQGADAMLGRLVDHYTKSGEPTIIVFFGDHLPYLGDEYKAFKDAKFLTGENDPEFLQKMYQTPFLVWNNYLPENTEKLNMSSNYLGPYVLKTAKLPGTYYTDYLNELYKKIPLIPPKDHYAKMGIDEKDLKEYETLQYDILFGSRHGYAAFKDKIVSKNYVMGLGPMSAEKASVPASAGVTGESSVTVTGANFPHLGIIYLNGKPLKTTWSSHEKLTAVVPAELNKPGTWSLDVRVIDNKDAVIAQTNAVTVDTPAK